MRIEDIYQTNSEWLKAKDLNGRNCNCRIGDITEHTFPATADRPERRQLVLHFTNLPEELAEKKFGLNVTNAMTITELYGPETDDWIGRYITLFATKTRDQSGNWVDCIRIRNVAPQAQRKAISNGDPKPPVSRGLDQKVQHRQGPEPGYTLSTMRPVSQTVPIGEPDDIAW